jgi:hypothetical protein
MVDAGFGRPSMTAELDESVFGVVGLIFVEAAVSAIGVAEFADAVA